MPLPVYRLRRWLAVITVLFSAVVIGMYVYARMRQHSVLKDFPGKISYDIKQTANGFQFSKSEAGRTVFTIRAKDVKEFKLNGRAELHQVSITLYGRDSSRFDQIYGDDFSFDPKSGDVTAKGEVQIDLEANPAGLSAADQAPPKVVKNPIRLKTRDLVFNRNSGDAFTPARVDFTTPQAEGWAVGLAYVAKSATLTLASEIHLTIDRESEGKNDGKSSAKILATHGVITRQPREIVLDHARMERESGTLQADEATFFLGAENEVNRIVATGEVSAESKETDEDAGQLRARADSADLLLSGKQSFLRTATLTGNVHAERTGKQPSQGDAGRVVLDFAGENVIQTARASEGVRLAERQAGADGAHQDRSTETGSTANRPAGQDFDIAAAAMDFFVADGRRLDRVQTLGAAKITISPVQGSVAAGSRSTGASVAGQRTIITAGRFDAKFVATEKGASRLSSVHGSPDAKIVTQSAGVPDRVSTSETVDAAFLPQGGIASIIQQGKVFYNDGLPLAKRTHAWAENAIYTPAEKAIVLKGSPRVSDGAMMTTANTIRIDRNNDDALAEGDVKSTYSDLKEQPNGALLASASPIHVTAARMTAHNYPAVAFYEGNARLWQDANLVEAPSIQFDRDRRSLVATGTAAHPVSTVLVQAEPGAAGSSSTAEKSNEGGSARSPAKGIRRKADAASPVTITSAGLTYTDEERKAHYSGGVTAQGNGFTARANEMDVFFSSRNETQGNQLLSGTRSLDHMDARGDVNIQEPGRKADSQRMIYTAAEDKFVLTGGPPSIFDAEHGKITGVSLTFFRADDRVLVEGEASTPVVTQTQMAR